MARQRKVYRLLWIPPAVAELTVIDQVIQGWYIYIPMLAATSGTLSTIAESRPMAILIAYTL